MRTVVRSIQLFNYDELNEESKERAREQFTSEDYPQSDWFEYVYEEFKEEKLAQGFVIGKLAHSGFYDNKSGASIVRADTLSTVFDHLGLTESEAEAAKELYASEKVTLSIHEHTAIYHMFAHGITFMDTKKKELNTADIRLLMKVKKAFYLWHEEAGKELYKRLKEDYENYHARENIEEEIRKQALEYDHLGTQFIL